MVRSDGANLSKSQTRATCLIIYTGGTIGMKPDASDSRTLRPAAGYIEGVLQTVVEFHHPDVPTYDVLEWDTPLDSSDFSPQCWIRLAEQIEQHYYVSSNKTQRRAAVWIPSQR